MKLSLSILFLILINGQHKNVEGEYYDYFGSKLKIYSDSTFLYTWHFDLVSSWSKGKWKMKNDTIYFEVIPVYDTLRRANLKDSLVLSISQKPQLITDINIVLVQGLISGGQNRQEMSSKLYFKRDKLIGIKQNGNLNTKKEKGLWTNKKFNTWFVKKE